MDYETELFVLGTLIGATIAVVRRVLSGILAGSEQPIQTSKAA